MNDPLEPLILDLLESIQREPQPRAEVMDAWRTSCPRLPVWEEALSRGFIAQRQIDGQPVVLELSAVGVRHLTENR
jgi:hypothetical protein